MQGSIVEKSLFCSTYFEPISREIKQRIPLLILVLGRSMLSSKSHVQRSTFVCVCVCVCGLFWGGGGGGGLGLKGFILFYRTHMPSHDLSLNTNASRRNAKNN